MTSNIIRKMPDLENPHSFDYIQSFEEYDNLLGLIRKSFTNSYIVLRSDYGNRPISDFQYSAEFPVFQGGPRLTQSILLYGRMLLSDTNLVVISSLERRPTDPVPPVVGIARQSVSGYGVFDIVDPTLMMPYKIIVLSSNSLTIFMLFKYEFPLEISDFGRFFDDGALYYYRCPTKPSRSKLEAFSDLIR